MMDDRLLHQAQPAASRMVIGGNPKYKASDGPVKAE